MDVFVGLFCLYVCAPQNKFAPGVGGGRKYYYGCAYCRLTAWILFVPMRQLVHMAMGCIVIYIRPSACTMGWALC